MTLFDAYLNSNRRPMQKWHHYFPIYENHLQRFRNTFVTLFQIGVGQGGSLQLWKGYLGPAARIVGLDVNPLCRQCEEDRISVRIGRPDDAAFLASVIAEFGPPDIVIDDGSHRPSDATASFDVLYPGVARNGVYLAEHLRTACRPDHGGGPGPDGAFIGVARRHVDAMHADDAGGMRDDRTTSIHFYAGVVVLEVGERRPKAIGSTGNPDLFNPDWVPPGETAGSFAATVEAALAGLRRPGAEFASAPANTRPPAEGDAATAAQLQARTADVAAARLRITELEGQVRSLSANAQEIVIAQRRIGELEARAAAVLANAGTIATAQRHINDLESRVQSLLVVTQEIQAAHRHIGELERLLRAANAEISLLRASTSWRITRPLRAAAGLLR